MIFKMNTQWVPLLVRVWQDSPDEFIRRTFLSSVNFYPFLWSFSPFNIGRIQNWSKNDKLLFQMIFLKRQLVSEGLEQFHQSEGIWYPLYMKVRKPSKSDSMSLNQDFFYQLLFYRVCKHGLFLGWRCYTSFRLWAENEDSPLLIFCDVWETKQVIF